LSVGKRGLKKILYLNETASIGGAENSLLLLIKYLDKDLFKPIVVLPEEGLLSKRLKDIDVRVEILKLPKAVPLSSTFSGKRRYRITALIRHYFNTIISVSRLWDFIRKEKIDLIHSNSLNANIWWAAPVGFICRVPIIWHVRDILPDGNKKRWYVWVSDKMVSGVIVVSNAVGEMFKDMREKDKIKVIYNGVDVDKYGNDADGLGIRMEFNVGKSTRLVGIVGRLDGWKGQDVFIDAAAIILKRLDDIKFLIVGDAIFTNGGFRGQLERKAHALGVYKDIIFTGFRDDIHSVLMAMDIFVHASVKPDPFPRTVIEAMASGKPIVATSVGGVVEAIHDGVNGRLIPPSDPDRLAESVILYLSDKNIATKLSKRARKDAEELFSISVNVEKTQNFYRRFINI